MAFGIPAMMHVLGKRKGNNKSKALKGRSPLCLVLSPTRELAQQVCSMCSFEGLVDFLLDFLMWNWHI